MKEWLNYHHLYYFWMIARMQSVSAAAQQLRLAQPTLSAQLRQLEEAMERKLFDRQGRNLVLTDDGHTVFRYAESIFSLGEELKAVLAGASPERQLLFRVGVSDSLPKFVVHKTLMPIHSLEEPVKLECYEGKREDLFTQLGAYELDLVLSDAPFASEVAVKAFNHSLGASGISLYATKKLNAKYKGKGLGRFKGAPIILPTRNTMIRRAVDTWLEQNDIQPNIIAEFEDSALLKTFGAEGHGFFPIASVTEQEVERAYSVEKAAVLKGVKENFYAISLERKVTHPAILAISDYAKKALH